MFKLISWNIQQGGGTRIASIVRALSKENAHCIILSEFKNNDTGQQLRGLLLKAGYKIQFVHAAPGTINSVLIASKIAADSKLHLQGGVNFPHAIIEAIYPAFSIFGAYLPHKKSTNFFPTSLIKFKAPIRH